MNRVSESGSVLRVAALVIATTVCVGLYYVRVWPDVSDFVESFDVSNLATCNRLFCDFVQVFHPMGARVLTDRLPIPGYYYTGFFALLLAPFGAMPLERAVLWWGLLQVAGLLVLFALPLVTFRKASSLTVAGYTLAFLLSGAVLHNFRWGQVSGLVTASMIGSVVAYRRGSRPWAAIWLAIGTSIKYYPALLALYYVARREFKLLAIAAAVCFTLMVAVPALALGWSDAFQFERGVASNLADTSWVHLNGNSQFVAHVVARRFGLASRAGDGWTGWMAYALGALTLGTVGVLLQRKVHYESELALAVLLLTTPFLLETSWPHYFVFLPFCQFVVFQESRMRGATIGELVAAGVVIAAILGSVLSLRAVGNWPSYSSQGFLLAADLVTLASGAALLATAPAKTTAP